MTEGWRSRPKGRAAHREHLPSGHRDEEPLGIGAPRPGTGRVGTGRALPHSHPRADRNDLGVLTGLRRLAGDCEVTRRWARATRCSRRSTGTSRSSTRSPRVSMSMTVKLQSCPEQLRLMRLGPPAAITRAEVSICWSCCNEIEQPGSLDRDQHHRAAAEGDGRGVRFEGEHVENRAVDST